MLNTLTEDRKKMKEKLEFDMNLALGTKTYYKRVLALYEYSVDDSTKWIKLKKKIGSPVDQITNEQFNQFVKDHPEADEVQLVLEGMTGKPHFVDVPIESMRVIKR